MNLNPSGSLSRPLIRKHLERRLRDDLFGAVILGLIGFSIWLDVTWRPFQAVFTWASLVSWVEDAAITAFGVWYFRDHVGQRVTAWWHKHHAPHLQAQLNDQTGLIGVQLDSQTGQLAADIAEIRENHFEHLRAEITDLRAELQELKRHLLE